MVVASTVLGGTTPDIVGTSINAPVEGGKYQLELGSTYSVTVTLAAGTVTYNTRIEGNGISSSMNLTPSYRNDVIDQNSGNHTYTFTVTPSSTGTKTVAFKLKDNGTGNYFDYDSGVSANVYAPTPPDIVGTSIAAPPEGGKYQLELGSTYDVTVTVAAGTVTYNTRIEGNGISSGVNLSPSYRDDTIDRNTGNHTYSFTVTPSSTGTKTVAFKLKDNGTGNYFDYDSGVSANVYAPTPPDIVGTTIAAPVEGGKYQLELGTTYNVTVTVAGQSNTLFCKYLSADHGRAFILR